ncbi:MAG TPA: response regulator [Verrucomicrobiae bacterium]|nr:response regulator [Verrucomicrobiae bacterium]
MNTILLAEDSEDDVFFFKRALQESGTPSTLQVVSDGAQAIDYLSGAGPFADRRLFPFPGFLLLDINLPRQSGLEVLSWIRHESPFRDLPVVILTQSDRQSDIDRARELGADAYFMKPIGQKQLGEMFKNLTQSWHRCGAFPTMLLP